MALTLLKSRKRRITNGWEVCGVAQFTTSDLTGELKCELGVLDDFSAQLINLPGAPAGTYTRVLNVDAPSVGATQIFRVVVPVAGTVAAVKYVSKEGQAAHASIGWDWHVVNAGAAGSGTAKVVDRADTGGGNTNLTGVGGGSALTAKTPKSLTVTATAGDKLVAAGDVLEITMTKNSTATTQTEGQFIITITEASTLGAEERVYLDETFASNGLLSRPAAGTLTVTRVGQNITSAAMFRFRYTGY